MAGKRGSSVPRPTKADEYDIIFGNAAAERGWTDLKAVAKNALSDAWDYLTAHPARFDSSRCYQLRGDAATVFVDGIEMPKSKRCGRVIITSASPGHPNETDSSKNFR